MDEGTCTLASFPGRGLGTRLHVRMHCVLCREEGICAKTDSQLLNVLPLNVGSLFSD